MQTKILLLNVHAFWGIEIRFAKQCKFYVMPFQQALYRNLHAVLKNVGDFMSSRKSNSGLESKNTKGVF